MGLLVGAKYTGPFYFLLLIVIFGKDILNQLNVKRLVYFMLPFTFFGLSWYLRNIFLTRNPIYPQPILNLEGYPDWKIFTTATWQIILRQPIQMFNAIFSEYVLWSLSMFVPLILFFKNRSEIKLSQNILKLIYLGIGCFVIYLFLYTSENYQIMVSSLRYSIPAFTIFILVAFNLLRKTKYREILIYGSLINSLPALSFAYHPKLLIFLLPIIYFFYKK